MDFSLGKKKQQKTLAAIRALTQCLCALTALLAWLTCQFWRLYCAEARVMSSSLARWFSSALPFLVACSSMFSEQKWYLETCSLYSTVGFLSRTASLFRGAERNLWWIEGRCQNHHLHVSGVIVPNNNSLLCYCMTRCDGEVWRKLNHTSKACWVRFRILC